MELLDIFTLHPSSHTGAGCSFWADRGAWLVHLFGAKGRRKDWGRYMRDVNSLHL
jgi:hypothetical protein